MTIDLEGSYVFGENGVVVLTLSNGTRYTVTRADGKLFFASETGEVYEVEPMNAALCRLLYAALLAGAIAGLTYMGCKVSSCLNKMMSNHVHALTTNEAKIPPQPPKKTNEVAASAASLIYPSGASFSLTNMDLSMGFEDLSTNGVTDWQGNLVAMKFRFWIEPTNIVLEKKDGSRSSCSFMSSTDLVNWEHWKEPTYDIMWLSIDQFGLPTNVVTMTYFRGQPWATNWYRAVWASNYVYTTVPLYSGFGTPAVFGGQKRFWKVDAP